MPRTGNGAAAIDQNPNINSGSILGDQVNGATGERCCLNGLLSAQSEGSREGTGCLRDTWVRVHSRGRRADRCSMTMGYALVVALVHDFQHEEHVTPGRHGTCPVPALRESDRRVHAPLGCVLFVGGGGPHRSCQSLCCRSRYGVAAIGGTVLCRLGALHLCVPAAGRMPP